MQNFHLRRQDYLGISPTLMQYITPDRPFFLFPDNLLGQRVGFWMLYGSFLSLGVSLSWDHTSGYSKRQNFPHRGVACVSSESGSCRRIQGASLFFAFDGPRFLGGKQNCVLRGGVYIASWGSVKSRKCNMYPPIKGYFPARYCEGEFADILRRHLVYGFRFSCTA